MLEWVQAFLGALMRLKVHVLPVVQVWRLAPGISGIHTSDQAASEINAT